MLFICAQCFYSYSIASVSHLPAEPQLFGVRQVEVLQANRDREGGLGSVTRGAHWQLWSKEGVGAVVSCPVCVGVTPGKVSEVWPISSSRAVGSLILSYHSKSCLEK